MGELILIAGLLMAAALLASRLAGRLRVPGLLLFLAIGMAIGSDGLGWLDFDDYELARDVGIVALALIIFEGGLSTSLRDLRPVIGAAVSLSVLGTLLTAVIAGLAAAWLFDWPLLEGLLLGSIVASTDAAAVFALLRGSPLRRRLARLLEGEAGSNDPVAILLVLGFIEWIQRPDYGLGDMSVLFARQVLIGAVAGVGLGWVALHALRRAHLPTPGCIRLHRSPSGRSRSARPTSSAAPASSPSTWPGSQSGPRRSRPSARSPPSMTGSPGSPSSRCS